MSKKGNYIIGGAVVVIAATAALSAWIIKRYYPEMTPWTNDAEPIPYPPLDKVENKKWAKKYAN